MRICQIHTPAFRTDNMLQHIKNNSGSKPKIIFLTTDNQI